jgi:hypothetical protein
MTVVAVRVKNAVAEPCTLRVNRCNQGWESGARSGGEILNECKRLVSTVNFRFARYPGQIAARRNDGLGGLTYCQQGILFSLVPMGGGVDPPKYPCTRFPSMKDKEPPYFYHERGTS